MPQKQTNFVEQNIKPNYRQQQNYPLTPTHTSSQTFVGQSHLSQPTQLVEQHRQQSGVQNFAVSSTQINFVNQNDISENVLRESRHHYVFKNATFDEDGDEIDTPSDRIYRGWELDPHEFPWMVKLMVSNLSNRGPRLAVLKLVLALSDTYQNHVNRQYSGKNRVLRVIR